MHKKFLSKWNAIILIVIKLYFAIFLHFFWMISVFFVQMVIEWIFFLVFLFSFLFSYIFCFLLLGLQFIRIEYLHICLNFINFNQYIIFSIWAQLVGCCNAYVFLLLYSVRVCISILLLNKNICTIFLHGLFL